MSKRKKAAAAAVTVAAVAGMVTASVIDTPAELLADTGLLSEAQQEEVEDAASASEEKQRSVSARIRAWLLGLPAAVRMLVGLPLWCLGWMLLTALSTFWAGAMTPLAARLLGWVCLAVIILVTFALSVKAAFPNVPFRRILRLRNVLFLLGMTALLAIADLALPSVWQGYDAISQLVWRIGATCLLIFSCGTALKRQGKRAAVQLPAAPQRTAIEEEARRLADTVCPPRY